MRMKAFKGCQTTMMPRNGPTTSTAGKNCIPVVVQVTAPPQQPPPSAAEDKRLAGVDVVALVDTSHSMKSVNAMGYMKEAMTSVIQKLGDNDRLAIVSFTSEVNYTIMGLTKMCGDARREATGMINSRLDVAERTDMIGALNIGAKILEDRENSSRLGCMMLLSNGGNRNSNDICNINNICDKYAAYTFGLGPNHCPRVMKHIADCTRGTYSFVNLEVTNINTTFVAFINHIRSVAAMSVEITLNTHELVTISKVHCGGYHDKKVELKESCTSVKINMREMYACETKSITVFLDVAAGESQKLLTVSGRYHQTLTTSETLHQEQGPKMEEVTVDWSETYSSELEKLHIHSEVEARLAWIELEDRVKEMLDKFDNKKTTSSTGTMAEELEKMLVEIKAAQYYSNVSEANWSVMKKTVLEMKKGIDDGGNITKSSGMRYMRSWLTCCNWQRKTWLESSCIPPKLDVVCPPQPAIQPGSGGSTQPAVQPGSGGSTQPAVQPGSDGSTQPVVQPGSGGSTQPAVQPGSGCITPGTRVVQVGSGCIRPVVEVARAWWGFIVSKPWLLCGALPLAVALLFLFAVTGARLILQGPSWWWWLSATTTISTTGGVAVRGNATSAPLIIPQHAGWVSMEKELVAVVQSRKEAEEGKTGSLFHQAASSDLDMDLQIQRYLYMAIVHATVLRRRRLSVSAVSVKEVRSEVSRYLGSMPKAMEDIEIPSFEGTTVVEMKERMNRYLYSTIVQSSVVKTSYWEQSSTSKENKTTTILTDEQTTATTFTDSLTKIWKRSMSSFSFTRSTETRRQQVSVLEQQLQEKNELVVRIKQELQEKVERVRQIELQLEEKTAEVVTLREEVTSTAARFDSCSKSVEAVNAQLKTCKLNVRRLRGKISMLHDDDEDSQGGDGVDDGRLH
ncbi:uncharacterized protein LOC127773357 [Oryza glaberrima]|uniref:uncharacterized protein LOC127773357 n=1 Tax=Oryza glaberrima TaxID=4538 RepID=UPI00224C1559|nr:uncharacterized protein LOC127773357 [Oryza glaberrima]